MIEFTKGQPQGERRILAKIEWGGDPYYDVLYFHEDKGFKYPDGYYDQSGENVPTQTIVEYAEF